MSTSSSSQTLTEISAWVVRLLCSQKALLYYFFNVLYQVGHLQSCFLQWPMAASRLAEKLTKLERWYSATKQRIGFIVLCIGKVSKWVKLSLPSEKDVCSWRISNSAKVVYCAHQDQDGQHWIHSHLFTSSSSQTLAEISGWKVSLLGSQKAHLCYFSNLLYQVQLSQSTFLW